MADYNAKVFHRQGGDELVVAAGGKITIEAGGGIEAAGGQAAAISDLDLTGTYSTDDDGIEAAVNGILAALRGAGIIAAS